MLLLEQIEYLQAALCKVVVCGVLCAVLSSQFLCIIMLCTSDLVVTCPLHDSILVNNHLFFRTLRIKITVGTYKLN